MVPHAWFDLSFVDLGWFDSESVFDFEDDSFSSAAVAPLPLDGAPLTKHGSAMQWLKVQWT